MIGHYSVVRYVEDPIRDEAVNIGVILVYPEITLVQFQFPLHRVSLGSRRAEVLRRLIESFEVSIPSEVRTRDSLEELRNGGGHQPNSIYVLSLSSIFCG